MSLLSKKEILNISLLPTNKCLWCTNSHCPRGEVPGLKESKELGNNVKIRTKMSNPGDWPPKPWEASRALLHGWAWCWHSGWWLMSQRVSASWAARPSWFAVKPLCAGHIGHTTPGSPALSPLTGLLSVPTKKERIFWLPRCVRCLLHKERFCLLPRWRFVYRSFRTWLLLKWEYPVNVYKENRTLVKLVFKCF